MLITTALLSLVATFADTPLEQLTSADASVRYGAVIALKDHDLDVDAVPVIRQYIEREIADMEAPLSPRYAIKAVPYDPLPRDTGPVRLRANPQAYADEIFTVVGQVAVTDYYNFGYRDAQKTHYAIEVASIDGDGRMAEDRIYVYFPRTFATVLVEKIATADERKTGHLFVRFKVTLDRDRGIKQADMLEGLDWQFYDAEEKTWTPWTLESLGAGIGLLDNTGKPNALVDVITQETPHGSVSADGLVRYTATLYIARMEKSHRNRAIREIKKAFTAARRAKNDELAAILNRAARLIVVHGAITDKQ